MPTCSTETSQFWQVALAPEMQKLELVAAPALEIQVLGPELEAAPAPETQELEIEPAPEMMELM